MENKDWLINLIYCELPGILNDATFIGLAAAIRKEIRNRRPSTSIKSHLWNEALDAYDKALGIEEE